MFYEERVIDGVLMCRSAPDGEWKKATTAYAKAVNALLELTEDQRITAMQFFCDKCGTEQPYSGLRCQCWNDE